MSPQAFTVSVRAGGSSDGGASRYLFGSWLRRKGANVSRFIYFFFIAGETRDAAIDPSQRTHEATRVR